MNDADGSWKGHEERLSALARLLGYSDSAAFHTVDASSQSGRASILDQAFTTIGIWGAFVLRTDPSSSFARPIVYITAAPSDEMATAIHRMVWSQGAAPILMVVQKGFVRVSNGFAAPGSGTADTIHPFDGTSLPPSLQLYHANRMGSSLFWKDFQASGESSIDGSLVRSIAALNATVSKRHGPLRDRPDLVNRMIGKLLYLYILIDRRFVSARWMEDRLKAAGHRDTRLATEAVSRRSVAGHPAFTGQEVWCVLDAIDDELNGNLFEVEDAERALIPDAAWHLIHSVVRNGTRLDEDEEQPAFFDVEFAIVRTETISAIYEQFLKSEKKSSQKDDGAFYTPPFLAEYALHQVALVRQFTPESRVLDPAAGSGIFVVQAFRMLMEVNRPKGGWNIGNMGKGRKLLLDCIFAIDINPQAIGVCRFSLCLTLLDYVTGIDIDTIAARSGSEKFLPDLRDNLRVGSAIGTGIFAERRFSHLVGNPPWTHADGQKSRENIRKKRTAPPEIESADAEFRKEKLPVIHNRLSDRFVWASKANFLEPDGVMGFLLPTKTLVGRHSNRFARAIAEHFSLRLVCNLSHLRYRLFKGARAPACLVVAVSGRHEDMQTVRVQRPQLTSLPRSGPGDLHKLWSLFVSESDEEIIRSSEFVEVDNGWFAPLMLGSRERAVRAAFRRSAEMKSGEITTIGRFLDASGLTIAGGKDHTITGVPPVMAPRRPGTKEKPLPRRKISSDELSKAKTTYQQLFAGNLLLLPRSAKSYEYVEAPEAFNSSFNAIYDPSGRTGHQRSQLAAGLRALKLYLDSDFAQYLLGLFGAHFLMDKQRFEKGDLVRLPIPYRDIFDPTLLRLLESRDVGAQVLADIKASDRMAAAVEEFAKFNKNYADGAVPRTAYDLFAKSDENSYLDTFRSAMGTGLPGDIDLKVRVRRLAGDDRSLVTFDFGKEPSIPAGLGTSQFVSKGVLLMDDPSDGGVLVKSNARFAWTRAQADEDARMVLARITA